MLKYFPLAIRHKQFKPEFIKIIKTQNWEEVASYATDESRKLYTQHTQVARAICKIQSFLRFEVSAKGILYSKITCEHEIVDKLLDFFQERFPTFTIAIEHNNNTYSMNKNKTIKTFKMKIKDAIKVLEQNNHVHEIAKELDEETNLWSTYYSSQNIKERKNTKLMKCMMPKKYMSNNHIERNINTNTKQLTEFI